MPSTRIAAWILSLATDPDRATTTIGDFSEEASSYAPGWFWKQVARTLGAHVAHDFKQAPGRLLLSVIAGAAFGLAAYLVLVFSMARLAQVMGLYYRLTYAITFASIYVPVALVAVGQCIARVSRRPLAAWILWGAFCTLLWGALALATRTLPRYPFETVLLVLLGAV